MWQRGSTFVKMSTGIGPNDTETRMLIQDMKAHGYLKVD